METNTALLVTDQTCSDTDESFLDINALSSDSEVVTLYPTDLSVIINCHQVLNLNFSLVVYKTPFLPSQKQLFYKVYFGLNPHLRVCVKCGAEVK